MRFKLFKIMGILNVTPDSFSDGGEFMNVDQAIKQVDWMVQNNVDIVDIGGESTRPGSSPISVDEEMQRVLPIIKEVKKIYPNLPLSIDTTKYEVAQAALDLGVEIINDISGLQFNEKLAELAASYNAGLIIMHMKGTPQTMQTNPHYDDVVEEVYSFLEKQANLAQIKGVEKIWVDVGIGFGKTFRHNLELLRNIEKFNDLGFPQVLGISRKSFIGKMFNVENVKDRDIHTVLIHSVLLQKGIDIVRVHNVEYLNYLRKIAIEFN